MLMKRSNTTAATPLPIMTGTKTQIYDNLHRTCTDVAGYLQLQNNTDSGESGVLEYGGSWVGPGKGRELFPRKMF